MTTPPLIHRSRQTGAEAELLVAYRFLAASRLPAWPLVPCAYDLLVDSGDGISRVQVKQAQFRDGKAWTVKLTKRHQRKDRVITVAAVDYVCIVCTPNEVYVLPAGHLASATHPDQLRARIEVYEGSGRFAAYRNAFAIGRGVGAGDQFAAPAELVVVPPALVTLKTSMHPQQQQGPSTRKAHVRLTTVEVNNLLQFLGENPSAEKRREAEQRWNVTYATVLNYAKRRRKDLGSV